MSSAFYIQTSRGTDDDGVPTRSIDEEIIIRGSLNATIPRHFYHHPQKGLTITQPPIIGTPVILAVSSQMCDLVFISLFHHGDITLPTHLHTHVKPCELNDRNLYFDFLVGSARYTTNRFVCQHRRNLDGICEILAWPKNDVPFIKISAHIYNEQK